MKKLLIFLPIAVFSFSGCLIFHKISYTIKVDGNKGTAEVNIYDIRSDADSPSAFDEDKDYLFNYIWKSSEFIDDMKKEGKEITERNPYLSNDTLNGKIVFNFNKINDVESNLIFEDNFYYLTIPLEDSVITTNGEIMQSKEFKRILWDSSFKELKFEILSFSFEEQRYRPMGYYFKSLK